MTNKFHIGQKVYVCTVHRKTNPNDDNNYGLVSGDTITTIGLKRTKDSGDNYIYYFCELGDPRSESYIFTTEVEAIAELKSLLGDE